jgi:methyl-accepting chemotaxis protein
MSAARIERAVERIEAAMERIAAAREGAVALAGQKAANSTRVVELVNSHEKLREQVAESLRELDDLIGKLEE